MKINDKNGKLIAIILNFNDANDYKNFYTDNEADMQFGVFNLPKNEEIANHYHPSQQRIINTTSEALILIEGKLEVSLYDDDLEHIKNVILDGGSVLITVSGGHGIKTIENTKLIEIKQGPYNEETDKVRF